MALSRPQNPSWSRSELEIPRFRYFLATWATSRRLAIASLVRISLYRLATWRQPLLRFSLRRRGIEQTADELLDLLVSGDVVQSARCMASPTSLEQELLARVELQEKRPLLGQHSEPARPAGSEAPHSQGHISGVSSPDIGSSSQEILLRKIEGSIDRRDERVPQSPLTSS